jgi:hypothetical protein
VAIVCDRSVHQMPVFLDVVTCSTMSATWYYKSDLRKKGEKVAFSLVYWDVHVVGFVVGRVLVCLH